MLLVTFTSINQKYRQVKFTKQWSTSTNYAILIKQIKTLYEKELVSNLKSMQIVGFEQISTKFIEIYILQEFLYLKKKNGSGNHLNSYRW